MINFNSFDKNYVLISSDRLIFNSKEESIYMTSKKTVGISALEQFHINVGPISKSDPKKHYVIINSPKIQLGLESEGDSQPVAKADSTVECLDRILDKLLEFASQLKSAAGVGVGTVTLTQVNIASDKLSKDIMSIKQAYTGASSPIKSKITNTL